MDVKSRFWSRLPSLRQIHVHMQQQTTYISTPVSQSHENFQGPNQAMCLFRIDSNWSCICTNEFLHESWPFYAKKNTEDRLGRWIHKNQPLTLQSVTWFWRWIDWVGKRPTTSKNFGCAEQVSNPQRSLWRNQDGFHTWCNSSSLYILYTFVGIPMLGFCSTS